MPGNIIVPAGLSRQALKRKARPMSPVLETNTTAFDALATDYDQTFTHSRLGKLLRPRVWHKLARYFSAGQHILELTCGTGEDAVWLAKQGLRVTATDGSPEMVKITRAKAKKAGVERQITAQPVSLQQVAGGYFEASGPAAQEFDGVLSNFGGLNTIDNWRPLARALATIVRPGGHLVWVPMGPFCPWEIMWYLAHGRLKAAFRRWARRGATAKIGQAVIPIWYPSAGRLRADFAPWFQHLHTESLGLWLPPSYLDHFVNRWPDFFAGLNRFETATAHLTKGWGDHYITIFKRK